MARCLVGLLMVAWALASGGGAHAGAGWLPEVSVSAGGQPASGSSVAIDGAGNVVAAWSRYDGANYRVQASLRSAGSGSWGQTVDLSAAGGAGGGVKLAVDPQGNVVAVWARYHGHLETLIHASVRSSSTGTWSSPATLSAAGGEADSAHVAVDSGGNAVAVWQRSDGSALRVQAAAMSKATGTWGAPVDLSAAGQPATSARVALDGAGNAFAVWGRFDGTNARIQTSVRSAATGLWSTPVDLSAAGQGAHDPRVAVDATGNVHAVWRRFDGSHFRVQASRRSATTGVWDAPVNLSAAGQSAHPPDLAVAGLGRAVVVWSRSDGANLRIQGSIRDAASGLWRSPNELSAAGRDATEARVGVTAAGDAVALWTRYDGANIRAQAATLAAAFGTWGAPVGLSPAGQDAEEPSLALDGAGNGVATWVRYDGVDRRAHVALYDATGPALTSLSVPASATRGATLTVSVSAADALSGLASLTWSFGDGTTMGGAQATHSYQQSGAFSVTITATDNVGNVSTLTLPITVAEPALAPAPPLVEPELDRRAPAVRVRARALRIGKRRLVQIPVRCPAHETFGCTGSIRAMTHRKISGHLLARAPSVSAAKRRVAVVKRKRFAVRPGKTRHVRARVSKEAAALVRRSGKLRVRATIRASDRAGNTRTTNSLFWLKGPAPKR